MCNFQYWTAGILLLLIGGLPGSALAQEQDTTDQQLPEIAPREIEIRGELQVSFPTLERQPLRGFASPPTTPSVPENRTAYVESYQQKLENLPESLPAPEAVSQSVSRPNPPKHGFMEVGGGRYASRFAEGHLILPFTSQQSLTLDANYFGTEGFTPFTGNASGVETPSDQFDGFLRFESRHDDLAFRATARGAGSRYTLYGLPSLPQLQDPSAPERTSAVGGVGLELRTYGSIESRAEITYDATAFDTEQIPTGSSTNTFQENRVELDGHLEVPLGTTTAQLDATAARSSYSGDVPSSDGHEIGAGFTVEVQNSNRLSAEAGGRVLNFDAPTDPTQSADQSTSALFIIPAGEVTFSPSSGFSVYAENRPSLTRRGLSSLYARSPYAAHAPSVRPTLFTTNAASGLQLSFGSMQLEARAGYKYAPTYQYFVSPVQSSGSTTLAPGALNVQYGSARILHGGGQLALQGVDGVEASVQVSIRDGQLVSSDSDIPYFSPLLAEAMFAVSFADHRGSLQTTGTVESPRPVNPTSDREIGTYASFDIEGSYEVTSLLEVVLEVRNLSPSAPERWARYPQPPAMISGGFRIHW